MRPRLTSTLLIGLALLSWMVLPGPEFTRQALADSCTPITTANDLHQIKRNMAGSYCLTNDIDLAGIDWQPLARTGSFSGTLDGQGHVIRNLTVRSAHAAIGLFGEIDGGTVSNLTLAGVSVRSTGKIASHIGALAGSVDGDATISNVRVTGTIFCKPEFCRAGGLVGELFGGTIQDLSSDATVTGGHGGASGGLVGESHATIVRSYATGVGNCPSHCALGGLVGQTMDASSIESSFASGPVSGGGDANNAGGLIGTQGGAVTHSYATGRVFVKIDSVAAAFAASFGGPLTEVFGAGRVHGRTSNTLGGLSAETETSASVTSAYWDLKTSKQTFTTAGVGRTTRQLQARLPRGFGSSWGIAKGYSYPYLNLLDSGMFASTLASVVFRNNVYTFAPLGQLEPTEYNTTPAHADAASLAAVYTMLARGIGRTADVDAIANTKIDEFFWNDGAQTAIFAGPVTSYAQLGSIIQIGGAAIDDSNIIGAIKAGHVVIIRGTAADTSTHWMLATLFTSARNGATTALVANDPWTGTQVRIDPATKQVTFPVSFPLTGFTVDQYQVVTQVTP